MKNKNSRAQAIIFDLDDTIYDAEQAYENALKKIGFSVDDEFYRNARTRVKNRLSEGHVSSHNRILYFKTLLEEKNDFSPRLLLETIERYEAALYHEVKKQWDDLRRDSLFTQLQKSFYLAVVTNENTRTQIVKLKAIDPEGRYFKTVITSEEFGVEKPNPKLFEAATTALGISLKDCCVVGDHPTKDLEPAFLLGARAFQSLEFVDGSKRGQFQCISKLDDLLNSDLVPELYR